MLKNILRIMGYAILLLLVTISLITPAFAQGEEPTDDEVNKIAKQLYCPVCESTPLDVCPTEACRQWRELIRTQLAEGKSEEEIKQYFVTQYGARVLVNQSQPRLAYLAPVTILGSIYLIGMIVILVGAVQAWKHPPAQRIRPLYLTVYLIINMIGAALILIFIIFPTLLVYLSSATTISWTPILQAVLGILIFISIIAVWNWKRWGAYGITGSLLILAIINYQNIPFVEIASVALFVLLILPIWKLMD